MWNHQRTGISRQLHCFPESTAMWKRLHQMPKALNCDCFLTLSIGTKVPYEFQLESSQIFNWNEHLNETWMWINCRCQKAYLNVENPTVKRFKFNRAILYGPYILDVDICNSPVSLSSNKPSGIRMTVSNVAQFAPRWPTSAKPRWKEITFDIKCCLGHLIFCKPLITFLFFALLVVRFECLFDLQIN